MNDRLTKLLANIKAVLLADNGLHIAPERVFDGLLGVGRERKLTSQPFYEIAIDSVSREQWCDDADKVTCDATIRVTRGRGANAPAYDMVGAVLLALLHNANLNTPEPVGVLNNWTSDQSLEQTAEVQIITLVLHLTLVVPEGE